MFTGIVEARGLITEIEPHGAAGSGDVRLRVGSPGFQLEPLAIGDSIAVSGVCLTVVRCDAEGFWADASSETLACTTLGAATAGTAVNLERALRLSTPLGGHLVSGHVDGVGHLIDRSEDARSVRMRFEAPGELARYIAVKGSICVDGVSLTVNDVEGRRFGVNIVPHTLAVTTLGQFEAGGAVNLEVDLVARYLERLLQEGGADPGIADPPS